MSTDNASSSISTTPNPNLPKRFIRSRIPTSILSNPALNAAISLLPAHYDFDIHKTIHTINSSSARRIALQFPDGLLLFALPLADILLSFSTCSSALVLSDPTFGACCLDDFSASALSADLLLHYGHSCLVSVQSSLLPVSYIFVHIRIPVSRLISAVQSCIPASDSIALAGTVQFGPAVAAAKPLLEEKGYRVVVPRTRAFSAGEVLGCTAPVLGRGCGVETVVFVADGRFHLEAFMIANPGVRAYRYEMCFD